MIIAISPVVIWYKGYDLYQNQFGHWNVRLNGAGIDVWHGRLRDALKSVDRLNGKPEVNGINICGGW